jgi:hypothetical protein
MIDNVIVVINQQEKIPPVIVNDTTINERIFVPPMYGTAIPGPQGPKGEKGEPGANNSITITANTLIGGGRIIAIDNEVPMYASNQNKSIAKKVIGISTGAAEAGSELTIQTSGLMTDPAWNWDIEKPLFLGTNGIIVQEYPEDAEFLLIVGQPVSNDTIKVNIETPILLK